MAPMALNFWLNKTSMRQKVKIRCPSRLVPMVLSD
jgi:hypothetical protein